MKQVFRISRDRLVTEVFLVTAIDKDTAIQILEDDSSDEMVETVDVSTHHSEINSIEEEG